MSQALLNESQYHALYKRSLDEADAFWSEQAEQYITWFKPWSKVRLGSFEKGDLAWFIDGKLNASFNCLDRHLATHKDHIAIIWEGDDPKDIKKITYQALYETVCRFANALKTAGVKKGDRVCIYMPMIPEAAIAMLACSRIGAIHSVVFAGFSAEALRMRIQDAKASILITADEGLRGGKTLPIKKQADEALKNADTVKTVFVVQRTGKKVPFNKKRDIWFHEALAKENSKCIPEYMDAQDPLFILYTSGSTGKPKGILHGTGGYLVYAALTHHYIFNYQPGDIYWCTADIGWITGHSYVIYGPLLNGATTLMYEGTPYYPDFSRFWNIVDRHQVNIFYTAPTAIRALRREGDDYVHQSDRSSLRILGSVGEPINPDVWEWFHKVVGKGSCPIVDTWWQTETGGAIICPLPYATPLKAGSACWPFFGIVPGIVDENGNAIEDDKTGELILKQPWPGMMQTIYGDHERFMENYFHQVPGAYFTGDGAKCDEGGYYWITGRNDDVIKVSGHRISSAELENAFIQHKAVSEAAVTAIPDDIKGQAIYAFITLKNDAKPSESLNKELIEHIRKSIGPLATPAAIQWASDLPKTRSGKIMRRILRKIACGEKEMGDVSTLANPEVVEELMNK